LADSLEITRMRLDNVTTSWSARLARAPKKPRCCVEQYFDQAFPGRLDAVDPARKTNLFNPPMPDASSPLFGVLIAGQYRNWRGVLFDLLNEPHTPKRKLWDDEPYSSLKRISRSDVTIAAAENDARADEFFTREWHDWVRYFSLAIVGGDAVQLKWDFPLESDTTASGGTPSEHVICIHPEALLLVAGRWHGMERGSPALWRSPSAKIHTASERLFR
jgi:hypothetical protein